MVPSTTRLIGDARRSDRHPRRVWRPVRAALGLGVVLALVSPGTVAAHQLGGRFESPLPLVTYLLGAAIAVALSFAFVFLRDPAPPNEPPRGDVRTVSPALRIVLRAVGLIAWAWIAIQAVLGGSSAADVSSLFLWVYGWVGLAIVCAFIGPAWTWLDPFTSIYDLLSGLARRAGIRGPERARYPAHLAQWPAVAGFCYFVWLELAYRAAGTGVALLGYTIVTLAAMAYFGRDAWRANGETFSVWFGLLGRIAPFALEDADGGLVRKRPFASGLLEGGWTQSAAVLAGLGAASILYDGLSQTEPWFSLFGFPDVVAATVQLAAFLALVGLLVWSASRLIGVAALGAGLVPIAIGYLVAHYLTYLLADGQRIVVAISDPFQQGWDLFGTAFYVPSLDWLPPVLIWTVQLISVVGGHMLGAWAGHAAAARDTDVRVRTIARQIPLAILMVILTTTTLWSLGQSVVQPPGETGTVSTAGLAEINARPASVPRT